MSKRKLLASLTLVSLITNHVPPHLLVREAFSVPETVHATDPVNRNAFECSDGRDNDGDGLVDVLTELDTYNGEEFSYRGTPWGLRNELNKLIGKHGFGVSQIPDKQYLVQSFDASRAADRVWNVGRLHEPTLTKACNILGYREYDPNANRTKEACGDGDRGYPSPGKCNFHSPLQDGPDNYLSQFNGSDWEPVLSGNYSDHLYDGKYEKTWASELYCVHKLPACSDGRNNGDGDDVFDYPNDPGCTSPNDNSEYEHEEEHCDSAFDDTERANADLSVTLSGTENTHRGVNAVYTVQVKNDGPDRATEILLQNELSSKIEIDENGTTPGCTQEGSKIKCEKFELDPGQVKQFSIAVKTDNRSCNADISHKARVLLKERDPDTSNNVKSMLTHIVCTECNDRKDNDRDTFADLDDPGCTDITDTSERNPNVQCDDGVDNDDRNGTDFPKDPNCDSPTDPLEQAEDADMTVTIDTVEGDVSRGTLAVYTVRATNNGPADTTNVAVTVPIPTGFSFNTGSSNCVPSGNNVVCTTPGISATTSVNRDFSFKLNVGAGAACNEKVELTATVTADQEDRQSKNDTDTVRTSVTCTDCNDDIDNDGDELNNHPQDPGCESPEDPTETNPNIACDDGKDNDGDKLVDLDDPDCSSPTDTTEDSADLRVSIETPEVIIPRESVKYYINVDNDGPNRSNEIKLRTRIPTGFEYNDGRSFGSCEKDESGIFVDCTHGYINRNSQGRFTIAFDIPEMLPCGENVFAEIAAQVEATTEDPNNTNNLGTASTPVDCRAACDDGKDNDGDGLVDRGSDASNDPGCSDRNDTTETNPDIECDDGVSNNDSDTLVDFPHDPQCESATDDDESLVDVEVLKSGPIVIRPGEQIIYDVTVKNNGVDTAQNVVVTDFVPSRLDLDTENVPANCAVNTDGDFECTLSSLAAGQNHIFRLPYIVRDDARCGPNEKYTTTAEVTADKDAVADNNEATFDTGLECHPAADLEIKRTNKSVLYREESAVYTATVKNRGPDTATAVIVSDQVPAHMTFDAENSTPGCIVTGAFVVCPAFSLDKDATQEVVFAYSIDGTTTCDTEITTESTVQNQAERDPNDKNDTVSSTVRILCHLCENGLDDDDDGAVDLDDFSCQGDPTNDDEKNPKPQCDDGINNNDSDQFRDFPEDPGCEDNQDNDEYNDPPTTGLVLSKVGPQNVIQGGDAIFTISATNNGPHDATNAVVYDMIPEGLTFDRSISDSSCRLEDRVQGIFASAETHEANFGDLAGADAFCQAQADSASLGGTWRAVMSDSQTHARDRFNITLPLVNTNGDIVALNESDLWDGTIFNRIQYDQHGNRANGIVYTGTDSNGFADSATNNGRTLYCDDWTTVDNTISVEAGRTDAVDNRWISIYGDTDHSATSCTANAKVYCVSERSVNIPSQNDFVACNLNTLENGRTVDLEVGFNVDRNLACGPTEEINNTAFISSDIACSQAHEGIASANPVRVDCRTPETDLAITESAVEELYRESTLLYTITVTNNGPDDATDVTITDPVPAGLTLNTGLTTPGCAESVSGTVSCENLAVANGDSVTVTVAYDIDPLHECNGEIISNASVSTTHDDNTPGNDTSKDIKTTILCHKCEDGIDNDNDGAVDLDDFSCQGDPTNDDEKNPEPECDDGVNNDDGDDVHDFPNDPGCEDNQDNDEYNDPVDADVGIEITAPEAADIGTLLNYTLTFTNEGPATATNVTSLLESPTGLTFDAAASPGCSENGGNIFCGGNGLEMESGADPVEFNVAFALPENLVCNAKIKSRATIAAEEEDPETANNATDFVETRVNCPVIDVDLVGQLSGPSMIAHGSPVVFAVRASNNGPGDADAVTVELETPSSLTFDAENNPHNCTENGNTLTCEPFALANGGQAELALAFILGAKADCGDMINVNLEVRSDDNELDPDNNKDAHDADVICNEEGTDLSITKTANQASILPGEEASFTVTVQNIGNEPADNIVVTDTIPDGLVFNADTSSNACHVSDTARAIFVTSGKHNGDFGGIAGVDSYCQQHADSAGLPGFWKAVVSDSNNDARDRIDLNSPLYNLNGDLIAVDGEDLWDGNIANPVLYTENGTRTAGAIVYTSTFFSGRADDETHCNDWTASDGVNGSDVGRLDRSSYKWVNLYEEGAGATTSCSANAHVYCVSEAPIAIPNVSGTVVQCDAGFLGAGDQANFTVAFNSDAAAECGPGSDSILNTADVTTTTPETNLSNNSSTAEPVAYDCPVTESDLEISHSGPENALPGDTVTYTLNTKNNGPSENSLAGVFLSIPQGFTLNPNGTTEGCELLSEDQVRCNNLVHENGEEKTFEIVYDISSTVACGYDAETTAFIASGQPDGNLDNNTSLFTTAVGCPPISADLAVTLVGPAELTSDDSIVYTFTAVNNGPDDVTGAGVVDEIQEGFAFDATTSSANCSDHGNEVRCMNIDLVTGVPQDFTIGYVATDNFNCGTTVLNTVTIASAEADPDITNNLSNEVVTAVNCPVQIADLAIVHTGTDVKTGETALFTLDTVNNGPFLNSLAGVFMDIPEGFSWNEDQTTDGCELLSADQIRCNNLSYQVGEEKQFIMALDVAEDRACDEDVVTNTFIASGQPDGNLDNNVSEFTINVECAVRAADLAIVHTGTDVKTGETALFTLDTVNNGPFLNSLAGVFMDIPEGFSWNEDQTTDGCELLSADQIRCNNLSYQVGEEKQFIMALDVAEDRACDEDVVTNTFIASGQPDGNLDNNVSEFTINVECAVRAADLAIVHTGTDVKTGETALFTLDTVNNGPFLNSLAGVFMDIPEGFSWNEDQTTDGCELLSADQIRCNNLSYQVGEEKQFIMALDVAEDRACDEDVVTNTFIASGQPDGNLDNNVSEFTINVACSVIDLAAAIEGPINFEIGDTAVYTLGISNKGPANAGSIETAFTVPAGLELSSAPAGCSVNGSVLSCTPFALANGSTESIDVEFTVTNAAVCGEMVDTSFTVSSEIEELDATNNTAEHSAFVICKGVEADVEVEKVADNQNVLQGEDVTYTVTVTNNGPGTAGHVMVNDVIPEGLTFDPSSSSNACTVSDAARSIFVTSTKHNGDFGGIAGADSFCQQHANSVGLGGTWTALLSDSSVDARDRIALNSPLYNLNGELVALDGTDLWDGSIANAVRYNENGDRIRSNGIVFTSTFTSGRADDNNHCNDWTSDQGVDSADVGRLGDTDYRWINIYQDAASSTSCSADTHIYCVSNEPIRIAQVTDDEVSCDAGVLNPGESVSFDVHFATANNMECGPNSPKVNNTAVVTSSAPDSNLGNNSSDAQPVTIDCRTADLALTHTAVSEVSLGDTVVYTINTINNGPAENSLAGVFLDIPVGFTLNEDLTTDGCEILSADQVRCNNLAYGVGEEKQFEIAYDVSATRECGVDVETNAFIASGQPDGNLDNNISVHTLQVACTTLDLVAALNGPANFEIGDTAQYTLGVSNNGPANAGSVETVFAVPAGLALETIPSECQANGSTVSCTPFALANGDSRNIELGFTVTNEAICGEMVDTSFTVSSEKDETNPANNTAAHSAFVICNGIGADVAVEKIANSDSIIQGDDVEYTITVTNNGPGTASHVMVNDVIPEGLTFDPSTSSDSCTSSDTERTIFVTSTKHNGDFGGIAGVDSFCQQHADSVGLGGTWTALVSDSTVDARDRIALTSPLYNLNGELVALDGNDLWDGDIANAVRYTESGDRVRANSIVFTSTFTTGRADDNNHCNDWTSSLGSDGADVGRLGDTDYRWVNIYQDASSTTSCSADTHIYCVSNEPIQIAQVTDDEVSCDAGSLQPGESITLNVNFNTPANIECGDGSPAINNTATVTSNAPDTDLGNNTSTADPVHVDCRAADLAIVHTSSDEVVVGDTVVYTIDTINNGPSENSLAGVFLDIPEGFTLNEDLTTDGCSLLSPEQVRCNNLAYDVGEEKTFEIAYDVAATRECGVDVETTAFIASGQPDGNLDNNTSVHTIGVTCRVADLAITHAGPTNALPGDTVSYTLNTVNNGPFHNSLAGVFMDIPAGFTINEDLTTDGCELFDGDKVRCNNLAYDVGEEKEFQMTFDIDANRTCNEDIETTTFIASGQPDGNLENNTSLFTTYIDCPIIDADLAIREQTNEEINPGDTIRYNISATNNGPAAATNVVVTKPVPAGFVFDDELSTDLCYQDGDDIICDSFGLPVNRTRGMIVAFTVPEVAECDEVVVSTSSIESDENDPVDENNNSSSETTIVCPPQVSDMEADKTGPDSVEYGQQAVYTLIATNNGPDEANDVELRDAIPAGLTFNEDLSSPLCRLDGNDVLCRNIALSAGSSIEVDVVFDTEEQTGECAPISVVNNLVVTSENVDNDDSNNTADPVATDLTCPVKESDMSVAKVAATPTAVYGETITYTLTAINNGPDSASTVKVRDIVPEGLTFNEDASSPLCRLDGDDVLCENIGLSAGSSIDIDVVFDIVEAPTVCTPTTLENIAQVSSENLDSDESNNTSDPVSLTVHCPIIDADLAIREQTNEEVNPGDTIRYNVSATNNGPAAATNVVVTKPVPAGFVFDDELSTDLCYQDGDDIICDSFGLPVNRTRGMIVAFTVPEVAECDEVVVSTSSIESDENDPVDENNNSSSETTIVCPPDESDLSAAKRGPESVLPGETFAYVITIANAGPDDASDVVVTDTIPTGLAFTSEGTHPNCNQDGSEVRCENISLDAGASLELPIGFYASQHLNCEVDEPIQNTANVTSGNVDTNPGNNTSNTVETDVACPPKSTDMEAAKTGPESVVFGNTVTYTLTAINNGPDGASDIELRDEIPAGLTFNESLSSPLCRVDGTDVLCRNIGLSANSRVSIDVVFDTEYDQSDCEAGVIENFVTVSSENDDPDETNNTSEAVTTNGTCPVAKTDLAITEEAPLEIAPGAVLRYHVRSTNNGPLPATNVEITKPIPAGFSFNDPLSTDLCYEDAGHIICDNFGLPVNRNRGMIIALNVPGDAECNSVVVSTSHIESDEFDPIPENNDSLAETKIICPEDVSDMAASKTGPGEAVYGSTAAYVLTATNNGPDEANDVELRDTIPAGFSFNEDLSSPLCRVDGADVLCRNIGIDAGGSIDVDVVFDIEPAPHVCSPYSVENTVVVTSENRDPDETNNTSSAVTTRVICPELVADLTISKNGPVAVLPTDSIEYTILVSNAGPHNETSALVVDAIPVGLILDTENTSPNCQQAGLELRCEDLNVVAGTPTELKATFTIDTSAQCGTTTFKNTATVTGTTTVDPDTSNNTSETVETELRCPVFKADLALKKKADKEIVEHGDTLIYTLTATNHGPDSTVGAHIFDEFPTGLDLSTALTSPNCSVVDDQIHCIEIDLAVGDVKEYQVAFTVPATIPCDTELPNRATIVGTVEDPNITNNVSETVRTTVHCPGAEPTDLAVSITAPATVGLGGTLEYTITLENKGPVTAFAPMTVAHPVPSPDLTLNTAETSPGCILEGDVVRCTGTEDIAVNGTQIFKVTYTLRDTDTANIGISQAILGIETAHAASKDPLCQSVITASVILENLPQGDLNPANNIDTTATAVVCDQNGADLEVFKSGPPIINRGGVILYTLTVKNHGPGLAGNVVVGDTIPPGLEFNREHSDLDCVKDNKRVLCDNLNLPGGEEKTYHVAFDTFGVDCNGVINNVATVSTSSTDPDSENNVTDVVTTKVTCTQCNDGIDNDGDGATDWEEDFSCLGDPENDDESGPLAACQDGIDNDGDNLVDYPHDPGCESPQDNDEFNAATGADVSVKKNAPLSIMRGKKISYSITVSNAGPDAASQITVTDELATGLTFDSLASTPGCTAAGQTVTCDIPTLASGDDTVITLVATVEHSFTCSAKIPNQAKVVTGSTDPNPLNNSSEIVETTVQCEDPTLSIFKTDNTNIVAAGENLTYEITVTNTSTTEATGVTVVDTLPAHIAFVSADKSGAPAPTDTTRITWNNLTIPAQGEIVLTLTVTVSPDAPNHAVLTNTVEILETGASFNDVTVVINDGEQADLSVLKTGPDTIAGGETIVYTVTIANAGPGTARDVFATDETPAGLIFNKSASSDLCVEEGDSIICGSTEQGPHSSVEYKIAFDVPLELCGTIINNQAHAITSVTDPEPWDNHSSIVTTNVICGQQGTVTLSKTDNLDTVAAGETVTYDITLTNTGTADATGLHVLDLLPPELTFVSATEHGIHTTSIVQWTNVTVPASSTHTLSVTATVDLNAANGHVIENTAFLSGLKATDETTVTNIAAPKADVKIVAKVGPAHAPRGETPFSYTITSTNLGPNEATNVVLRDPIPAGLVYVSGPTECAEVTGEIVCQLGNMAPGAINLTTLNFKAPLITDCVQETVSNIAHIANNVEDPDLSNNASHPVETILQCPDATFTISKTDNLDTVNPGAEMTYAITVTNTSSSAVTGVNVNDELPPYLSITGVSDGGVIALPGFAPGTVPTTSGFVSWTIDLAAGETKTLTINVTLSSGVPVPYTLSNTANVAGESATDTTTVEGVTVDNADMAVVKTGQSTVNRGDTVKYYINATNLGPSTAVAAKIKDAIPAGLTFNQSESSSYCIQNGTEIVCNLGDMTAGTSASAIIAFTVPATVSCGHTIPNTATVESSTNDDNQSNNTSTTVQTEVQCPSATFAITKDDGNTSAAPGDNLTYTITVTNTSSNSADSVTVTDTLPSGLTFITASDSGVHDAGTVTWTLATLAGGASKTLTLQARVNDNLTSGTNLRNTATVDGQNAYDDTLIETTTGDNFTILLTDSRDPVEPDSTYSYTTTLTNLTSSPITNLPVTLTVDSDTDVESASDAGSVSTHQVTWSNVTIPAHGQKTLVATVRVDEDANDNKILRARSQANTKSDDEETRVEANESSSDDVTIRVTDTPDPVRIGDILTYNIRVCNEDEDNELETDVTAILDSDTSFIDASDGGDEENGDEVVWEDLEINEDDCETLRLRVRVRNSADEGSTLRLRARVEDEEDTERTQVLDHGIIIPPVVNPPLIPGGPLNPIDPVDPLNPLNPIVGTPSRISIDKSADRTSVLPGSIVTYKLQIRNTSSQAAQDLQVVDSFTQGAFEVSNQAGGSVLGNQIRWHIPVLEPNASRVITYTLRVNQGMQNGQKLNNTVKISGPDLSGSPSDTSIVTVVTTGPVTGNTSFISSAEANEFIRPTKRDIVGANADDTLPFIIWTNIIAIGIAGGWVLGRRMF